MPDWLRNVGYGIISLLILVGTVGLAVVLFFATYESARKGMLIELLLICFAALAIYLVMALPAILIILFARGTPLSEALSTISVLTTAVIQSGAFYFFGGIAFLATAYLAQRSEANSSLTFIIALLGIAILLYGTGSQAALGMGQGNNGQSLDASKIQEYLKEKLKEPDKAKEVAEGTVLIGKTQAAGTYVNFAVAGGAAALTAFFGWGITERAGPIRDVFRDHTRYDLVKIETKPSHDLTSFRIETILDDGRSIYMRTFQNTVYVNVPEFVSKRQPRLTLGFSATQTNSKNEAIAGAGAISSNPFKREVTLVDSEPRGDGSICKLVKNYEELQQVNDSGSIDAPIREWDCLISVQEEAPNISNVSGVSVQAR
jgi:hypothetical protein